MKKNTLAFTVVLALITGMVTWSAMAAEGPDKTQREKGSWKTAGTPRYAVLTINNLTTWHRYDGQSNHSPQADNGLYYPRGTGNLIYQDGVVFGGKAYLDAAKTQPAPRQLVRVGGGTYGIGTRAGYVNGFGASAVAADPAAPDVRIYRIRRDYTVMTADELRLDAAAVNEIKPSEVTDAQMQDVKDQYAKDWDEWPVAKGAPYIDRNGNGVYDKPPAFSATFTVDSLIAGGYDEPGVAGSDLNSPADQVIYTVYNDLHVATAVNFQGSEPLGLEIQKTVWGYKRTDAMGNLYFSRYKLINKGGVDVDPAAGTQPGVFYIDSMFVCQWSDPDLGSFSDDLVGCDPARSLGFVYNGNAVDATYRAFSLPPPSAGYDFLAGPTVDGAPTDSAVRFLKRVYGKKNLGMSSFAFFSAGSPYSDPCNGGTAGYACNTGQWWKMLRGFAPLGTIDTPDQPYANAANYPNPKFPLSGDPVAGTGWLDGRGDPANSSFAAGDRRILLNTGPFTMAPGDTQEVYVGLVVGLGADRLSSVAVMKANDNAVQLTFDLLFQVSRPPAPPNVTVTELDGQVILEWGSDLNRVRETETRVSQPGQYEFEGYNVYQLPSRGARLEEAKRIVTYDLPTEPRVIFDTRFDLVSGQFISVPIQFGTNSGIKRTFLFKRDYILDVDKIYNGQEYYLVVTAYSHAKLPGFTSALESSPNVITVRPKVPFGVKTNAKYLDTIAVTRVSGSSDGSAIAQVINPTAITGDTYQIRFDGSTGRYRLVNVTKGDTVFKDQTNQSGDDASPMGDGMIIRVFGAPNDAKDFLHTAGPSGPINPPTYAAFSTFNGWGFPAASGADALSGGGPSIGDWGGGRWGIHTGGSGGGDESYAGRFRPRVFRGTNFSRFVPYDFEIRFTAAGGKAYMAFTTGSVVNVPFELWNIGINTPNDPSDDHRMIPWIFDEDGDDQFNLQQRDHGVSGGDNDPYTDWIYWYEPQDKSPGQAGYNAFATMDPVVYDNDPTTVTDGEVMARVVLVNVNGGSVSDPTWPTNVNSLMPATGNVIRIVSTKPNQETDVFAINTATYKPTKSAALEKVSAEKIGVFPNPYYAFNAAETNRFERFVTFNNLPPKAKIRIFNLAGQLVKVIEKNDPSQFVRWSLTNTSNYPVASGIYIAYVEATLPTTGEVITKTLKFAIIQEQEILNTY